MIGIWSRLRCLWLGHWVVFAAAPPHHHVCERCGQAMIMRWGWFGPRWRVKRPSRLIRLLSLIRWLPAKPKGEQARQVDAFIAGERGRMVYDRAHHRVVFVPTPRYHELKPKTHAVAQGETAR